MPSLINHSSGRSVKLLLLGESGTGKTGSLISLVCAGYKLRIMDFENGVDILKYYLLSPTSPYAAKLKGIDLADAIHVVTLQDKIKSVNGRAVPVNAIAWGRAMALMDRWKDGDIDLGKPRDWDDRTVLVWDTLSSASEYALNHMQSLNGNLGSDKIGYKWQRDVGEAQKQIGKSLEWMCEADFKPNVIIMAHVRYLIPESEQRTTLGEGEATPAGLTRKGFPRTIGKELSPQVAVDFNNVLQAVIEGDGPNEKRKLVTTPVGGVPTKSSAPGAVKSRYDIATGLAEYFADLQDWAKAVPAPAKPALGTAA